MNPIPPGNALTEAAVREALHQVTDPEIGMNIVDLGLVYGIRFSDDTLQVDVTMTSPACPMVDMIVQEVRAVLSRLVPADTEITVNLVREPPWNPTMMSEHAKQRFGWK